MGTKEQLQQAKSLIQAKRYREARRVLSKIDHPTADRWLERLDEIAPVKESSGIPNQALLIIATVALVAVAILLTILVIRGTQPAATAVAVITATPLPEATAIPEETRVTALPTPSATATEQPSQTPVADAEATLTSLEQEMHSLLSTPLIVYCQSLEERSRGGCSRWTDAVLEERVEEVAVCYQEFDTIFDKDEFSACLLFFGISPIGEETFVSGYTIETLDEPGYLDAVVHLQLYCEGESYRNENWCYVWSMLTYVNHKDTVHTCVSQNVLASGSAGCFRQRGLMAASF